MLSAKTRCNGTGHFFIRSVGADEEIVVQAERHLTLKVANGEDAVKCFENDRVELFFDNAKKIETTPTGAVVTGILTATSFEGSGENLTNLPASGDANDITASLFT